MEQVVAKYCLSFSKSYVLGSDGSIYRLPFEGKGGKFFGIRKLRPLYAGRNRMSKGWQIAMPDGSIKVWYRGQIQQYFVKMEKEIVIKTM